MKKKSSRFVCITDDLILPLYSKLICVLGKDPRAKTVLTNI